MDPMMFPSVKKPKAAIPSDNLDLFAKPRTAPATASTTSQRAAASITPDTLKQRRQKVYAVLVGAGADGLTRYEIAEQMGVPQHWVTSSVDSLIKIQKMVTETHRTRKNPTSGKWCAVLVAVQFAGGHLSEEPAA